MQCCSVAACMAESYSTNGRSLIVWPTVLEFEIIPSTRLVNCHLPSGPSRGRGLSLIHI